MTAYASTKNFLEDADHSVYHFQKPSSALTPWRINDAPLSRSEYNVSKIISLYSVLHTWTTKLKEKTWTHAAMSFKADGRRGAKLKPIWRRQHHIVCKCKPCGWSVEHTPLPLVQQAGNHDRSSIFKYGTCRVFVNAMELIKLHALTHREHAAPACVMCLSNQLLRIRYRLFGHILIFIIF